MQRTINGKKVVDSKKNLTVHVSMEDCEEGQTMDPGACAAARAIMRENEDAVAARVHRGITFVEYPKQVVRYRTSNSLSFELGVFDRGRKLGKNVKLFEPGEHTLYSTFGKSSSLEAQRNRSRPASDPRERHDKNKRKITRHEISNIRPRGHNR